MGQIHSYFQFVVPLMLCFACTAFGILLWELASRGMEPYSGMTNDDVIEQVPKGCRLECPEGCPSKIYDMMKRCECYQHCMLGFG